MNKSLEKALIFVAGVGLGAIGSGFYFKDRYEKLRNKFNKEARDLESYYKNKLKEMVDEEEKEKPADTTPDIDIQLYKESAPSATPTENITPIVGTDYRKYYPVDEEDEINEVLGRALNEEDKELKQKGMHTIGVNDYGYIPYYNARDLLYYTEDAALVVDDSALDSPEETDQLLDEVRVALVDLIITSNFPINNDSTMWIRDPKNNTDYQINKVKGCYKE